MPFGSGVVMGPSRDQAGHERAEQGFAASVRVVHELEEAEIKRQLVLQDPQVQAQLGTKQRPAAFLGIDVDRAEPVLVAGVEDRFVPVAQAGRRVEMAPSSTWTRVDAAWSSRGEHRARRGDRRACPDRGASVWRDRLCRAQCDRDGTAAGGQPALGSGERADQPALRQHGRRRERPHRRTFAHNYAQWRAGRFDNMENVLARGMLY